MKKLLASLLLLSGIASAAVDKPVSSTYNDFSGGLNNYTASIYLANNESPNLKNVVIDEPIGQLSQRNGYTVCGHVPSGKTISNLFNYNKQNGSKFLILTDNETIWQTDDCQNFVVVWTGLSATNFPRFATIQDNLWVVNGSTWPIIWDGLTGYQLDGVAGRPQAPKAKYINFWRNRVFLGNTASDPSGVFYNAITTSGGAVLNPAVDPAAWTVTTNLIYFSRDDGNPIYGMHLYRDNLYIFKGTSGILRLVFNDEFSIGGINITKAVSIIGSKFNESITEMDDGLLRFVGQDGVYAFNGSMVTKISTKWTPTFYTILQPSQGEAYSIWDSVSDWATGTATDLVTNNQGHVGQLTLPSSDIGNWSWESGNTNWTLTGAAAVKNNSDTDIGGQTIGSSIQNAVSGGTHLMTLDYNNLTAGRVMFNVNLQNLDGASLWNKTIYMDQNYDQAMTLVVDTIPLTGITVPVRLVVTETMKSPSAGSFTSKYFPAELVPNGKINFAYGMAIQRVYYGGFPPGRIQYQYNKIHFDVSNLTADVPKVFSSLSGTWESADTQATGLTQWRIFDSVYGTNGETLTFQLKTASTQGGLAAATYANIVPGVTVSETSDTWFKWKTSMSTTQDYESPYVDRVGVNWVTGPLSKSAVTSTNYLSRYWVSASTDPANPYNNLTMVESKSPLGSYTLFDLPITAMAIWNNKLYGGIGDTDKIVILDSGTLDDTNTISSFWDSRDEFYGSPVSYKSINKMVIDYLRLPVNTNIQIGLSNDMGSTWSYKTLDTSMSSLSRFTKIINMDANRTLQFRSRISNNTHGIGFNILGVNTFGSDSTFFGN